MYRIGELVETWFSPQHMVTGRWVIAIIVRERNNGHWFDVLHLSGVSIAWSCNVKDVGEERD